MSILGAPSLDSTLSIENCSVVEHQHPTARRARRIDVALAFVGTVRHILHPMIHGSIDRFAVRALRERNALVDSFMVVETGRRERSNRDLYDRARLLYQPTRAIATTFPAVILSNCSELNLVQQRTAWFSQFYKVRLVFTLVKAEEINTRGRTYDWVVRSRTDVLFHSALPFSLLPSLPDTNVYFPLSLFLVHHPFYNDHVFLCPRALCSTYFLVYDLFKTCSAGGTPFSEDGVPASSESHDHALQRFGLNDFMRVENDKQGWLFAGYGGRHLRSAGALQQKYLTSGLVHLVPWSYSTARKDRPPTNESIKGFEAKYNSFVNGAPALLRRYACG